MKQLIGSIILSLALMLSVSFTAAAQDKEIQTKEAQDKKSSVKAKTETVIFNTSISCDNCKAKLEKHIPFEKGVKNMKVNVEKKTVEVTFDPVKTDKNKIDAAIEKLGYKSEEAKPEKKKE